MSKRSRPRDPEATPTEDAARVVDNAADLYADRAALFDTTLRNNAAKLTEYKRRQTLSWMKRVHEALERSVDEAGAIPRLGLSDYPDMDDL